MPGPPPASSRPTGGLSQTGESIKENKTADDRKKVQCQRTADSRHSRNWTKHQSLTIQPAGCRSASLVRFLRFGLVVYNRTTNRVTHAAGLSAGWLHEGGEERALQARRGGGKNRAAVAAAAAADATEERRRRRRWRWRAGTTRGTGIRDEPLFVESSSGDDTEVGVAAKWWPSRLRNVRETETRADSPTDEGRTIGNEGGGGAGAGHRHR